MRDQLASIPVLLCVALSACSSSQIPTCGTGLTPTLTVPPKLPGKTENQFVGQVNVSFVIDSAGATQHPVITSTDLRRQGRGRINPVGYEESVLAAVSKWRYPPMEHACRHQFAVEFKWED